MRRRGWLLAAIAQGLSLAVSLWLYSWFQPTYVYPIMAYCILMILYLNSNEVRLAFLPGRGSGGVV
jgi:VanZ family protein